jgi:hypothetical protein
LYRIQSNGKKEKEGNKSKGKSSHLLEVLIPVQKFTVQFIIFKKTNPYLQKEKKRKEKKRNKPTVAWGGFHCICVLAPHQPRKGPALARLEKGLVYGYCSNRNLGRLRFCLESKDFWRVNQRGSFVFFVVSEREKRKGEGVSFVVCVLGMFMRSGDVLEIWGFSVLSCFYFTGTGSLGERCCAGIEKVNKKGKYFCTTQ